MALADRALAPVEQVRTIRLGMAQLAPEGLSEQWLLRECGDIHWSLIAEAAGLDRAVFTDSEGRPAYAAFCATSLEVSRSTIRLQGAEVIIKSGIFRLSRGRTGSIHAVCHQGQELARLSMISTFVSHDESGLNRRIVRNRTVSEAELPSAPATLLALNNAAREVSKSSQELLAASDKGYRERPCPSLDFNAVGLLYFPVFSRLAERAQWETNRSLAPLARRDVVYLGNLDQGDSIEVLKTRLGMGIFRDDGLLIACVRTSRHVRPVLSETQPNTCA